MLAEKITQVINSVITAAS